MEELTEESVVLCEFQSGEVTEFINNSNQKKVTGVKLFIAYTGKGEIITSYDYTTDSIDLEPMVEHVGKQIVYVAPPDSITDSYHWIASPLNGVIRDEDNNIAALSLGGFENVSVEGGLKLDGLFPCYLTRVRDNDRGDKT